MRLAVLFPALLVAACNAGGVDTSNPINKKILLRWQVGEELMNACELKRQRCAEWLAFQDAWDKENGLISFETSLARHKARVKAGQAM